MCANQGLSLFEKTCSDFRARNEVRDAARWLQVHESRLAVNSLPLHFAAAAGRCDAVTALLRGGAGANAKDAVRLQVVLATRTIKPDTHAPLFQASVLTRHPPPLVPLQSGAQALHLAAAGGFADCISALISGGADVSAADSVRLPAPPDSGASRPTSFAPPWETQSTDARLHRPRFLPPQEGRTALLLAAAAGCAEGVRALLAAKADPSAAAKVRSC